MKCDDCGRIIIRQENVGLNMELNSGKKIVLCLNCTDNFLGSLVKRAMPYFIQEYKKMRVVRT